MILEQIPITGDRNFAYLFGDEATREAALVDPGSDADALIARIRERGLRLLYVLNTHGHPDHTTDSVPVCRATGAKLAAYQRGDVPLKDGDELKVGAVTVRVLYTPGHTMDAVCFLAEGNLFTGDTLFVGKIGGTPDEEAARTEYDSLFRKICALPGETVVWPGHDYGVRPSSTIGREMKENPFLLRDTFESFLDLKKNWVQYKKEHGIA